MGVYLARLNQNYLLGQAVDPEIVKGIKNILTARPAIEEVHSVQSQWIGPYAFSYKAEVDFDGTYLAAKLLQRYKEEFLSGKVLSEDEVKLLLSWFAEDVMRTVEREVKDVEAAIQRQYPEAQFIELEPDGRKASSAIDDGRLQHMQRVEIETLKQYENAFKRERLIQLRRRQQEAARAGDGRKGEGSGSSSGWAGATASDLRLYDQDHVDKNRVDYFLDEDELDAVTPSDRRD